jgi:hypothetical protein
MNAHCLQCLWREQINGLGQECFDAHVRQRQGTPLRKAQDREIAWLVKVQPAKLTASGCCWWPGFTTDPDITINPHCMQLHVPVCLQTCSGRVL